MNTDIPQPPNRRRYLVLWLLLAVLAGLCLYRYHRHRLYVGRDWQQTQFETAPLSDRINPNTASWVTLAQLPGIGPIRAKAIVEYRQQQQEKRATTEPVFRSSEDLQSIKGIGPRIAEQLEPYLTFDDP